MAFEKLKVPAKWKKKKRETKVKPRTRLVIFLMRMVDKEDTCNNETINVMYYKAWHAKTLALFYGFLRPFSAEPTKREGEKTVGKRKKREARKSRRKQEF